MALVQHKQGSALAGSCPVTLAATGAGNCLVVCVSSLNSVTGTTLGGVADNFTGAETAPFGAAIWIDPNAAGGQTALVVTCGGSGYIVVDVFEFSTVLLSSPLDAVNSAYSGSGGASWSSGGAVTGSADEIWVGMGMAFPTGSADTLTPPGTPWINQAQNSYASNLVQVCGYQAVTATGTATYAGTQSHSAANWAAAVITLKAPVSITHSGTGMLSGSGTLSGAAVLSVSAPMSGSGTLSGSGLLQVGTMLSGSGTLSGFVVGNLLVSAGLSGSGTLSPAVLADLSGSTGLSGSGTLTAALLLRYSASLSGTGTFGTIGTSAQVYLAQVTSVPQALPGSSQVAVAPPGSSNWQYLGTLGAVTALTYGFVCPGGCDQMTCTVMVPAAYRTQLFNPGWKVRITRGGHQVWDGKMDEPVPTAAGWNLTAIGTGNLGTDYLAIYPGTWPAGEPDVSVNAAITRGLPWVNPGIGSPSGIWLGQEVDSGAQTITALLTLITTMGGLTWYVNSQPGGFPGDDLSVFPLPTAVNRVLVCTTPVPRTLGGDINTIFLRYQVTADNSTTGATATYAVTSVQDAASVAAHGVMETYLDLSSAGVMPASAAQAVGNGVLAAYVRASFAGPFTASYGQLLTTGGQPIDPGTDQAGTVVRPVLTDYGYGGEVTPNAPMSFVVGAYSWDDFAQVATLTPYISMDMSLTGMLSMENTILTPITAPVAS
jgi:hypothetical protein